MNLELLNKLVSQVCAQELFSGVIRITQNDQILYNARFGYADRAQRQSFTEDSMFTLYSMSKPFCAIGLLLLVDQGLVDLDTHPGKYLPEAAGFHKDVTIRHMLHHTSGMPCFLRDEAFMKEHGPGYAHRIRSKLSVLAQFPNSFPPGAADLYSNINFTIPALIIENITGQTYADYMREQVFAPMGAKTMVVDNETLQIPNRVQGYNLVDGEIIPVEKSHDWMLGGGDLVGRVEDVYCLNTAVKHRLLLKPETWEQVLTPSPINNRGMGCTITQWHGLRRITHNGGHRGFRTFHVHFPQDDLDVIILSNSGFGSARQEILEAVYQAFYNPSAEAEEKMVLDYGLQ